MNIKTFEIPCTGYSVAADWYEGEGTDKILLNLHGYNSSKSQHKAIIEGIIGKTGSSALAFDLSGHGDSPFELRDTRPAQHFLELVCIFDWLKAHYPNAQISVMGSSYGGFLATQLTKYRQFDHLVLRVPAIHKPEAFYDLWATRIDNPETYNLAMQEYRTDKKALSSHPLLARAASFKGRTLVAVHELDEQVPRQTTDTFIAAFHADSFVAKGFTHSITESFKQPIDQQEFIDYQTKIATWLEQS